MRSEVRSDVLNSLYDGAEQPESATSKIASQRLKQYQTPLGPDAPASPTQVLSASSASHRACCTADYEAPLFFCTWSSSAAQPVRNTFVAVRLAKESFLAMTRLQERERNDSQNEDRGATATRASKTN